MLQLVRRFAFRACKSAHERKPYKPKNRYMGKLPLPENRYKSPKSPVHLIPVFGHVKNKCGKKVG